MDLELRDKIVLIAGSTRGIGLAIARAFLKEGSKVTITGRGTADLNAASKLLATEAGERRVKAILADMTDSVQIQTAIDTAVSSFGGLDCVVANLGRGSEPGGWNLSLDNWRSSIGINLLGSMNLASCALPHLIASNNGSLIFVASIAGLEAINAPVAYSATKAAILSAMKSLSRLVGTQGVRVNAVAPGNVLFRGGTWEKKLNERPEFFKNYIASEVPLQRFGAPEEIADSVVFLASKRASFISGACLVVDGGQTRSF